MCAYSRGRREGVGGRSNIGTLEQRLLAELSLLPLWDRVRSSLLLLCLGLLESALA